jgi:tripartite-type tricarboxylate transporter receptor subunit TctC
MSRPFVLPPGVPAERVAALREAFGRLAQDPAFLAEMERTGTEVSFRAGQDMERLMARIYAFPPALVERIVEAISSRPASR